MNRHDITLQLLAAAEATGEADPVDVPHIVRVHDPEIGPSGDRFWGPYPTGIAALAAAGQISARLNRGAGPDDALFVATAHPIFTPVGDQ